MMMNKCEEVICPIVVYEGDGLLNHMFRSGLPSKILVLLSADGCCRTK